MPGRGPQKGDREVRVQQVHTDEGKAGETVLKDSVGAGAVTRVDRASPVRAGAVGHKVESSVAEKVVPKV